MSATQKHTTGRRAFLFGAASLLVAPAIVRASSLMPISVPQMVELAPVWRPTPMSFSIQIMTDTPEQMAEVRAAIARWQTRDAMLAERSKP